MLNKDHKMIRLYADTQKLLKIIAAIRQESLIECVHHLVMKEAERLNVRLREK